MARNGQEGIDKAKESPTYNTEKAIELGAIKFIVKSDNKPTEVVKQVREILKASTRDEIPGS